MTAVRSQWGRYNLPKLIYQRVHFGASLSTFSLRMLIPLGTCLLTYPPDSNMNIPIPDIKTPLHYPKYKYVNPHWTILNHGSGECFISGDRIRSIKHGFNWEVLQIRRRGLQYQRKCLLTLHIYCWCNNVHYPILIVANTTYIIYLILFSGKELKIMVPPGNLT